jgi:SAM-dependent MidA family methyltransferase
VSSEPLANLGGARPGHSLRDRIAAEILSAGPIPFSRYMHLCLYEPELGYYSQARERFGKAGDFYTSSDVHAVFGRLLSRQFEQMWRTLGSPTPVDVIELGPGRGLFARDLLDWSVEKFPAFSRALQYHLVEQSPRLRSRLEDRLREHITAGRARLFDSLEGTASHAGKHVIIFANEFFDVLPVDLVDHRGSVRVGVEEGRFVESFVPSSAAEIEFLDRYSVHPEQGERVEIAFVAQDWMKGIARVLGARRGFAVLIDYGYTREEQLAGRHRDTLMTYRQHTASASPYEAPGEHDITSHVNFTALGECASRCGLDPLALLTQSQFLIGIGEETQFADAFEECKLPQERAKVALQLKHLITPMGMGETFQVLLMSQGVVREQCADLGGLKLAR